MRSLRADRQECDPTPPENRARRALWAGVGQGCCFPLLGSWALHFTGATLKMAVKAKCWDIYNPKASRHPRALGFGCQERLCWAVSQPCSPQQAHGHSLRETVPTVNPSAGVLVLPFHCLHAAGVLLSAPQLFLVQMAPSTGSKKSLSSSGGAREKPNVTKGLRSQQESPTASVTGGFF